MHLKTFKNKFIIAFILTCIFTIVSTVGMHVAFPIKYLDVIVSVCDSTSISPNLVLAIIKTESSFDKNKISPKGAIGLMQIMPDTANYVSDLYFASEEFDLYDEKDNILIGVTYLIYLYKKFEDKKTVLTAFNAGEGRVQKWLDDDFYSKDGKTLYYIPYEETSNYVKKVLTNEKFYNLLN